MAFNTGGHIVRDNLLVLVDAANSKSYTSGAIIKNLVDGGNRNFINYAGAGVSGSQATQRIVFDGSNDYAQYAGCPISLQGNPEFTVFGSFYRTGTISAEGCWGFGNSTSLDGFSSYQGGTPNDISIDLWGDTTLTSAQNYPLNEWVLVHWVKIAGACNTTNTTIWVNDTKYTGGDLVVSRGGTNTPTIGSQGMTLGRIGYTVSAYYADMDIGFIAFYDRALTTDEVLMNFNAKRVRYGV